MLGEDKNNLLARILVRAEGSLCEFTVNYLDQVYVRNCGVRAALEAALAVTRWDVDVVAEAGVETGCWLSRLTPVIRLMEAMLSPLFLNSRIVTTWDMLIIFLPGLLSRLPKQ